jgi:hypothetical protein
MRKAPSVVNAMFKLPNSMFELIISFLNETEVAKTSGTSIFFTRITYYPTSMSFTLNMDLELRRASLMKRTKLSKVVSLFFDFDFTSECVARLNLTLEQMPELCNLTLRMDSMDNMGNLDTSRTNTSVLELNQMRITHPVRKLQDLHLIMLSDLPELLPWALKNLPARLTSVRRLTIAQATLRADEIRLLSTFTGLEDFKLEWGGVVDQPKSPRVFPQDLSSLDIWGHGGPAVPEAFCHAKHLNLECARVQKDLVIPACVKKLELGRNSYLRDAGFLAACQLESLIVHSATPWHAEFLTQIERHGSTLHELGLPSTWIRTMEARSLFAQLSATLPCVRSLRLPHDGCYHPLSKGKRPYLIDEIANQNVFVGLERVFMKPCGAGSCFLTRGRYPQILAPSSVELVLI